MSRPVLSNLSLICLLIAAVLSLSRSLDTPHGSLLWYLQDFSSLFIMGCLLFSTYSLERFRLHSSRSKKFLVGLSVIVLVGTLASTAGKFIEERERQSKEAAKDRLFGDLAKLDVEMKKLNVEMKQLAGRNPTRKELNKFQAQMKDMQSRAKQLNISLVFQRDVPVSSSGKAGVSPSGSSNKATGASSPGE
jgi:hypothetical protein